MSSYGRPVKVDGKVEIDVRLGQLEFDNQVLLISDIVDDAIHVWPS